MKIFDAHFHIINPSYPLVRNHGYIPPAFSIEDYTDRLADYELAGGALVSGSFQAFDQEYLVDALGILGPGFVGVANIPFDLSNEELSRLNEHGVRAVRFNLKRGGSERIKHLNYLSNKLYQQYQWHTELYLDSIDLPELMPTLRSIPAFSIDHLGLSKDGLDQLYHCVELGARIKTTGFGRINFSPIPVMNQILKINPEALLFGTDLPSTRARVPFSDNDIELIKRNFSITELHMILYKNAVKWYRC